MLKYFVFAFVLFIGCTRLLAINSALQTDTTSKVIDLDEVERWCGLLDQRPAY